MQGFVQVTRNTVRESLREPLETGRVAISRAARQVEFPAGFQLVAAMNPCKCGYLGHFSGRCQCTPDQVLRYRSRLSGPLLDRIDIQIEVPALPADDLLGMSCGEPSSCIRDRVARARDRMNTRQGKSNASLEAREIDKHCKPDDRGSELLKQAIGKFGLSARGFHRILKVARTIADLKESDCVASTHVAEAIQYRRFAMG